MRRISWNQLVAMADHEVRWSRERLPAPVKTEAVGIPVSYEPKPSAGMLEEPEVDDDTLGLFVGGAYPEGVFGGGDVLPAQIVLFLENLWDYAEGHERTFRREVRRTYLHELGHYLGLDENDLAERGLD